jgi:hypothetical protein
MGLKEIKLEVECKYQHHREYHEEMVEQYQSDELTTPDWHQGPVECNCHY